MAAYRLAYDGRDFHGYQRQPDVPTVEDALFDALRALSVLESGADRPEGYTAAGRTDAGVSAVAQTVTLAAPDWLSPAALNSELPRSVRAWARAESTDVHATHDAIHREYTYHLHAPVDSIDDDRVTAALERLSGHRRVDNLTKDSDPRPREVEASCRRDGPFLEVTVAAGGFPWEFVRRLISLVRDVGTGERSLAFVDRVCEPTPLDGAQGIGPAPPEPLVLAGVEYPSLVFERDPEAAAAAASIFDAVRVSRRTGSRVARHLRDGVSG